MNVKKFLNVSNEKCYQSYLCIKRKKVDDNKVILKNKKQNFIKLNYSLYNKTINFLHF